MPPQNKAEASPFLSFEPFERKESLSTSQIPGSQILMAKKKALSKKRALLKLSFSRKVKRYSYQASFFFLVLRQTNAAAEATLRVTTAVTTAEVSPVFGVFVVTTSGFAVVVSSTLPRP